MLVKFARPYFSKGGVHYPARVPCDIPDDEFQKKDDKFVLPAGAEIIEVVQEKPAVKPKAKEL